MKKRGQFYLIASFIAIIIISGLVYVYTNAESPSEDVIVYDLSEEISFEANQLIDKGVFDGKTQEEIAENIGKLIQNYGQANPKVNIAIVYGDETQAHIIDVITEALTEENPLEGEALCNTGVKYCKGESVLNRILRKYPPVTPSTDRIVDLWMHGEKYTFTIVPDRQNFFLVVELNKQEGKTVIVKDGNE